MRLARSPQSLRTQNSPSPDFPSHENKPDPNELAVLNLQFLPDWEALLNRLGNGESSICKWTIHNIEIILVRRDGII
jgi:hypothetical protein